jgi:ribosomal protein S27E
VNGEGQSTSRIVHISIDVKSWAARLPTVDEVRPGHCPACGSASRPTGGSVVLHGHGLRARDQWGASAAAAPAAIGEVIGRRYACQACGAVILIVPGGVLRRRLYSAAAVALALALWGVDGLAPAEVRSRVSPWRIVGAEAARGWASLRRWARAVRARRLFAEVRALPDGARLREVAARAATTLAARAPSSMDGLPLATRAFVGARM